MATILVLNGPNLNLLGQREVTLYGNTSLSEIRAQCHNLAAALEHQVIFEQSNHEGTLIEMIQGSSQKRVDFMIFNPAGYTHTSIALRDAILAVQLPFIELHLSNLYQREAFRQHSYFSDLAQAVIAGCGPLGYQLALQTASKWLENNKRQD